MLKIRILTNNVANSPITLNNEEYRGYINDLPEKLRVRVLEVMDKLNEVDVGMLEYNETNIVFYCRDKFYSIHPCPDFLKMDFLVSLNETIKLLHWYLSPHVKGSTPGVLGGTIKCYDCGIIQRHGRCEFAGCPSHAKWAEIIEGYEPPKYLSDEALTKVVKELPNNKPVVTEPNLGDEPNKWIQKG